jgi:soluble lytic murein transglycosylase
MQPAFPLGVRPGSGVSPSRVFARLWRGVTLFCCLLLATSGAAAQAGAQSTAQSTAETHKEAAPKPDTTAAKSEKETSTSKHAGTAKQTTAHRTSTRRRHVRPRASRAVRTARTARIRQAFIASSELRPMAQQLATLRNPEAYAGVTAYAHRHTGDAAAAAYLALGHAYLLDHRYSDAVANFHLAREDSGELADIADYLAAEADHDSGDNAGSETLLHGFAERYPDSIFVDQVPELEATVLLALNNPGSAREVLAAAADTDAADRVGYQLAAGQVEYTLGERDAAVAAFKRLLLEHPLSAEAMQAQARLTELGAAQTLTAAELRSLGDAYYNAGRYSEAAEQYRALQRTPGLSAIERSNFTVALAACELKQNRLTPAEAQALPDTDDENGARRLDLLMELARDRDDEADQQRIVSEMEARFPHSTWLAEALFSSGNMYLLKRDYANAVTYYAYLAEHFPQQKNAAAAHWRAGWLSYRQGEFAAAAKLFDDQIQRYPAAAETVSALYWRGRLYESMDHYPSMAAANYRAIVRAYPHYFYAQMARVRLNALGKLEPAAEPELDHFQPVVEPKLVDTFPADSPHLAKARLLANAGLNEYIAQEIQADPDSDSWSALAEAQIYASYDETFHALRAMKRALPYASSAQISAIPLAYWRILYPEPWWETIRAEAAKNNLDPYLVASLIRQESEFNPNAVSYANAYGLMQLLPSVGRAMAREEGMTHFQTFQLLDPETNIRLGTRYLRQMIDRFGGVQEYALAAYNAGDNRVTEWQAAGPYSGMDEFVESIPFTQTRDYVQAILRNEETYRAIDEYALSQSSMKTAAR